MAECFGCTSDCAHKLGFVGRVCEIPAKLKQLAGPFRLAPEETESTQNLKTDEGQGGFTDF